MEDFTTYDEVDPENCLTVISNRITVADMPTAQPSYVRDDKGAGSIGDFEHQFTLYFTGTPLWAARLIHWRIEGVALVGSTYTSAPWLCEITLSNDSIPVETDWYTCDLGLYYITVSREGTSLQCKIYSDAGRTNLLDTLSLASDDTVLGRYVYGMGLPIGEGSSKVGSYTENLDIINGEADGGAGGGGFLLTGGATF